MFRSLMNRLIAAPEPKANGTALAQAAAALLYEVARADGQLADTEMQALHRRLAHLLDLDDDTAQAQLEAGRLAAEQAVDYFEFIRTLRQSWGQPERIALINTMWRIADADGHIDPQEEYVIRKVADLLYVPHSAFVRARTLS